MQNEKPNTFACRMALPIGFAVLHKDEPATIATTTTI